MGDPLRAQIAVVASEMLRAPQSKLPPFHFPLMSAHS